MERSQPRVYTHKKGGNTIHQLPENLETYTCKMTSHGSAILVRFIEGNSN